MKIEVNKQITETPPGSTLRALIIQLDLLTAGGVAVAVNDQVIPRGNWDQVQLREDDRVLIIQAAQGG